MLRLQTQSERSGWKSWRSALQRQLDREAVATMEVVSGEQTLQVTPQDHSSAGLSFGPYGTSPLRGLHFEAPDDTAA